MRSRAFLHTIAQLAALAQTLEQIHQRSQAITPIDDADLQALWGALLSVNEKKSCSERLALVEFGRRRTTNVCPE
jgi:hypothetical protein